MGVDTSCINSSLSVWEVMAPLFRGWPHRAWGTSGLWNRSGPSDPTASSASPRAWGQGSRVTEPLSVRVSGPLGQGQVGPEFTCELQTAPGTQARAPPTWALPQPLRCPAGALSSYPVTPVLPRELRQPSSSVFFPRFGWECYSGDTGAP